MRLRALRDQVVVITGASSGIGLCTARMAARAGARVTLAARDHEALREVVAGLRAEGADALYVAADVGDPEDVRRIAEATLRRFGPFDTWINDAAVATFGRLQDVPLEEHRRLFETNFWGVVHGSLVALETLERRGGALINVGSAYSDRAVPLQGMYCASKHAVKAFTDALRMELEERGAKVAVTLVKPSAIDTPLVDRARSFLDEGTPRLPAPRYAPDVVARAILRCAEHPTRDITVGLPARALRAMEKVSPRATDLVLERVIPAASRSDEPPRVPPRGSERGAAGTTFERSATTALALHPWATAALMAGALGLLAARRR